MSDTDVSSLQASSSSTPGHGPAMAGREVGKGNGGESDSSEHVMRSAVARRIPSPILPEPQPFLLVIAVTEPFSR